MVESLSHQFPALTFVVGPRSRPLSSLVVLVVRDEPSTSIMEPGTGFYSGSRLLQPLGDQIGLSIDQVGKYIAALEYG